MVLLDVNVLIALADPGHELHASASRWFAVTAASGWATCPLTENGFLRVLAQPAYPRSLVTPQAVRPLLEAMRRSPAHRFLPDDVSLADAQLFGMLAGLSARQLTDIYLLGLAVHHGARFASFDRGIPAAVVTGGAAALEIIAV